VNSELLINILLFFAFVLDFWLAFLILAKKNKAESDMAFICISISIGLWTIGILLFRIVDNMALALILNREFIIASGWIASSFLHFAVTLTKRKIIY